jgi:hypothetical protein
MPETDVRLRSMQERGIHATVFLLRLPFAAMLTGFPFPSATCARRQALRHVPTAEAERGTDRYTVTGFLETEERIE